MSIAETVSKVVAVLACTAILSGTAFSSIDVGVSAPDFALRTLDGKNLRLSEYRSEVVVLNFWSSWCRKCRQVMPVLDQLYKQHHEDGLNVFAIGVEGLFNKSSEMAGELEIEFPILIDARQQVSRMYDLDQLPLTLVIDRAGNVRYAHKGFGGDSGAEIAAEIAELLAE
jgi:peroxiredoxin